MIGWPISAPLPQDGVSFEVRRYDGAKYAVVYSEGRTFDQVTGELGRKLLMYIGGSNEQGKPVSQSIDGSIPPCRLSSLEPVMFSDFCETKLFKTQI